VGTILINEGLYTNTKAHPLLSICSALINKVLQNPLLTYQIIYGLSGMVLSFSLIKILEEVLIDKKDIKIIHLFILLTPGILLLCLYSISNIFFTSLAYLSVYCFYKSIDRQLIFLSIISGFIVGLSYLARIDGMVLFFGLLLITMILSFLNKKSYTNLSIYFIFAFILTVMPWQIYLYSNDLILSTVIRGGYASGFWADGAAKYLLGDGTRLNISELNFFQHFFVPTAKNIVMYSEHIGSLKTFPFFLFIFIMFCFDGLKRNNQYLIFLLPLLSTFSYLFFYIESRYLIAAIPLLAAMSFIGLVKIIEEYYINKNILLFFTLSILLIMDICFLILWLS